MTRSRVGRLLLALLASTALSVSWLATPAAAATDTEVYTVQRGSDGRLQVSIHEPAEGVSAAQLRVDLVKHGVKGVLPAGRTPLQALGVTAAVACPSYGTAHAWCGHVWSYGPFNDPQVYFLDHTPSGYPVSNAVYDWYQSPGIDSYYRWYTQGCPGGGRHCVNVYAYTPASAMEYGLTTWTPGTQGPVTVRISTRIRTNARQVRKTTCHELGHALGLNHNGSTNSCLVSGTVTATSSLKPSSQDFRVLTLIYPKAGT